MKQKFLEDKALAEEIKNMVMSARQRIIDNLDNNEKKLYLIKWVAHNKQLVGMHRPEFWINNRDKIATTLYGMKQEILCDTFDDIIWG